MPPYENWPMVMLLAMKKVALDLAQGKTLVVKNREGTYNLRLRTQTEANADPHGPALRVIRVGAGDQEE